MGGAHFTGPLVSPGGLFLQAATDHDLQRGGHTRRKRRRGFAQDRRAQFESGLPGEGTRARCHLVEDNPQGPHIPVHIEIFTQQLFR